MPKGTNVRNLRQVRIKLTTLASQLLWQCVTFQK
jgi:hypothetical protein